MPDIKAAIRALTYDSIELLQHNRWHEIKGPILQRSISHELRQIEAVLGGKGKTNLFALAEAIDEALIALVEESHDAA